MFFLYPRQIVSAASSDILWQWKCQSNDLSYCHFPPPTSVLLSSNIPKFLPKKNMHSELLQRKTHRPQPFPGCIFLLLKFRQDFQSLCWHWERHRDAHHRFPPLHIGKPCTDLSLSHPAQKATSLSWLWVFFMALLTSDSDFSRPLVSPPIFWSCSSWSSTFSTTTS